jgi:hypothetical protein
VITGQSQGSASSIGASRIAPTYAPELQLRATIATGVLPEFPEGPIKLHDLLGVTGTTRYTMLRLVGGSLRLRWSFADELVTDQARPLLAMARETCGDGIHAYERERGIDMRNAFTVEPRRLNALMLPATEVSMVRMPAPLFLGTGLADRMIPPQHQHAAAAALCAAGNPLTWKTYPGITHNGGVHAAFDDALTFVRSALSGRPIPSNCDRLLKPGAPQAASRAYRLTTEAAADGLAQDALARLAAFQPGQRGGALTPRPFPQSPINAISMPAEAAAAVSTRATARVRKYGPCRRQLEGSGGGDTRSCTRCAALGSEAGGRGMDCTSVVASLPTIGARTFVYHCQT